VLPHSQSSKLSPGRLELRDHFIGLPPGSLEE
jgi:hypothetical protein